MAEASSKTLDVWQALDGWAKGLKPWQRRILFIATQDGALQEKDIAEVYALFLESAGLLETEKQKSIPLSVSGRPAEASKSKLRLTRIDNLAGINALPDGCALTFSSKLTVIYGRNGAGKSGFARVFANACFSRHKPPIVSNINKKAVSAAATFHFTLDDADQTPVQFSKGIEDAELRRISCFDKIVAAKHVSEKSAFEFKPSGFDIFPEMVRVCKAIEARLDADILTHACTRTFSDSFIGDETPVIELVAALDADLGTDLTPVKQLATYGEAEKARLELIDTQLTALKSKSPKEALKRQRQAQTLITAFKEKLEKLAEDFTSDNIQVRSQLSKEAKETAAAAITLGTEQFKRPFFNAIGTSEWEAFAKTAHALARKESETYPASEDHCLLCERPFDEHSQKHVAALLAFVEGDAQSQAQVAAAKIQAEVGRLKKLDLKLFDAETSVRQHMHEINPAIETEIEETINLVEEARTDAMERLLKHEPVQKVVDVAVNVERLAELLKGIANDIELLEKDETDKAILQLDLERQTLRHREVLTQLLPDILKAAEDFKWRRKANAARPNLQIRHITDKEKELFNQVIGDTYRTNFTQECGKLDCKVPVEAQTLGQKGQTVRTLIIKGGHEPEDILSDGEQRAIALADFLTEVDLNPINAGIVLDDPVNSQDHPRKKKIAARLVEEAKKRQVIVFTHDLPFLNHIVLQAEETELEFEGHWIDRDNDDQPGKITLNDIPATNKSYDNTDRAKTFLAKAKSCSGSERDKAIRDGLSALRRTIEETVVKKLLKGAVPRWEDRVIVGALRKITWDDKIVEGFCAMFEELSGYIDAHSHTDEGCEAPPEIKELEERIPKVDELIKLTKSDKPKKAA